MAETIGSCSVGDAVVELLTPSPVVTIGDTVDIETRLSGKEVTEKVDEVRLVLESYYRTKDGFREFTIDRFRLTSDLSVESGLTETRRSTITVPYETPVTLGSVDVQAIIELDVRGETRTERKFLSVVSPDRLQAAFDAMIDLGLALRTAECWAAPPSDERDFVERLEFHSVDGPFQGEFETADLFFWTEPDNLTLCVAVDREDDVPYAVPRTDESRTTLRSAEPDRVRDHLQSFLERNVPG